jgi:hypothetical protein
VDRRNEEIHCPTARQLKRQEVKLGSLRDRPEGEHEAAFHGSEQEMLRAPCIAWASKSFGGADLKAGTPPAKSVA